MSTFANVKELMGRAAIAMRAGLQFDGARDLYRVFGYKGVLQHTDFLIKYQRQDVAMRVIEKPVDATWTDPPVLKNGTAVWEDWKTFARDNKVWPILRKLDIFVGLGQYAVLLIGIDDGKALDKPVNTARKNKVIYLQPYLEGSIDIDQFDEDPTSARFGKPIMYEIDPGSLSKSRTTGTSKLITRKKFKVHHSRILHVADRTMENSVFGHSRLEPIFNVLNDILKVAGGSAETYWMISNRGMQVDVDKEMELDGDDAENLEKEIEEYQHELRRFIRTRGVKINSLGSDVADPKNTFGVLMALLSSATGIPQRVLMGAEAGQLASQQDRANWAITIKDRIANFAAPYILWAFIDKLAEMNVLQKAPDLEADWPEPFKMNPLERAQTSAQMARSAANVTKAMENGQKIGGEVLSIEEARTIIAPGTKMPELTGTPVGTLPEKAESTADTNEPIPPNEQQ